MILQHSYVIDSRFDIFGESLRILKLCSCSRNYYSVLFPIGSILFVAKFVDYIHFLSFSSFLFIQNTDHIFDFFTVQWSIFSIQTFNPFYSIQPNPTVFIFSLFIRSTYIMIIFLIILHNSSNILLSPIILLFTVQIILLITVHSIKLEAKNKLIVPRLKIGLSYCYRFLRDIDSRHHDFCLYFCLSILSSYYFHIIFL